MRFIHQPGSTPLAGYTIQRGIYRGGFGEVYYAHSDGGKEVALKLLQRDQDVELRGVQQCLNMKHPNLVNLFDVRTDSVGEQWVVMEYVNGTSLEDVLAAFPNGLPIDEVRDWLNGIIAGVGYLHDRGIVHRDLKPANVYRENGTVKVGDVGLSKRLGSDRRGTHTQSVGTVYYMAPEVARGQYGPEVDVYSLGIMLYEMLTGQVPFTGETTAEVLMKHLTSVPNLQPIPESLRPVVARALEKDPLRRTSSAAELEREFVEATTAKIALSTGRSRPVVATGFANGTAIPAANIQWKETRTGTNGRADHDTALSLQGVVPRPIPTRTVAQAASAYAQYPPEALPEPPPPIPSSAAKPPTPPVIPKPVVKDRVSKRRPDRSGFWPLLVAVAISLWLFSPGSWRSWSGLVMLGAAYAAGSALRGKSNDVVGQASSTPVHPMESASSPQTFLSSDSLAEVGTSLSLGSLYACLISIGGILSIEFIQRTPRLPSAEFMALFTATSIFATWALLLCGLLLRSGNWFEKNPRKTFLFVGIVIGSAAFFLDQFLMVEFSNQAFGYSPAYRTIGVHSLTAHEMNPTWLGYVVFFCGLTFWHRWGSDVSVSRSRRLSLGRVLTAAIAAWLLTMMFAFPQWPAILWAITISAAVQMAAFWTLRQNRLMHGRS